MPYPLLFKPIFIEKVWGGRTLESFGKRLPPNAPIGESWELADLPTAIPNGRSVIENGALAGFTLRDAIAGDRAAIMGPASLTADGGFPLLVKLLDARQNLSVQVHPDQAYVERHPETHLKSEAWVVLQADAGAVIYKGLKEGINRERFAASVRSGAVAECLHAAPACVGECHYLPSGTVHALGAGIVVAEVQTPSDTTFRVYDWGRETSDAPREMHLSAAMECISFSPPPETCADSHPIEANGIRTERLVKAEHFALERITMLDAEQYDVVTEGMPEVWMMLEGGGEVDSPEGEPVAIGRVRTALIPAAMSEVAARLSRGTVFLRITLPSPIDGAIA